MARILVIDDDEPIREMMTVILRHHGHTVISVPDGRKAFQHLNVSKVDLVITDVIMPEVDGVEVLRRLRISHPTLPIITVSGNPTGAMFLKMAKTLGARCTIAKPFEAVALINAVNDVLAQSLGKAPGDAEEEASLVPGK
jgi:DNA-binding response OmpR family regulator